MRSTKMEEEKDKKRKFLLERSVYIITAIAIAVVALYGIHRLTNKGIPFYEYDTFIERSMKKIEDAKGKEKKEILKEIYNKNIVRNKLERLFKLEEEKRRLLDVIKEFEASDYKEPMWPYLYPKEVSPYRKIELIQKEIEALKKELQISNIE